MDNAQNICVVGETDGDLDGNAYLGGTFDLFAAKYSEDGAQLWTQLIGTSSDDRGFSIVADDAQRVYLTGSTNGALNGNPSAGDNDIFAMRVCEPN